MSTSRSEAGAVRELDSPGLAHRSYLPTYLPIASTVSMIVTVAVGAIVLTAVYITRRDIIVSLQEAVASVRQAVQAAADRVAEDVAELKRQLEQGASAGEVQAAIASLEDSVATLQGFDPDPSFPGSTEPTPEPEPAPEPEPPGEPGA